MGSAAYSVRLVVLRRNLTGLKRANGEDVEEWPEPPEGTGRYSARRLALSAGEEIRQGVKESTSFIKLAIRGHKIPVEAVDRVRLEPDGPTYRLTGPPVRERRETILQLESI